MKKVSLKKFFERILKDLKEYFERVLNERDRIYGERFTSQQQAVSAALASSKEAIQVAENNSEKWRANANEWRAAMTDRERSFVRKEQHDDLKKELDTRFDGVSVKMAESVVNEEKRRVELIERVASLEKINIAQAGEKTGAKVQATEIKDNTARTMSFVLGAIVIAQFAWNLLSPIITKILLSPLAIK